MCAGQFLSLLHRFSSGDCGGEKRSCPIKPTEYGPIIGMARPKSTVEQTTASKLKELRAPITSHPIVATIGLDIENTFDLVGPDKRGTIVLRSKRCPYSAISHIHLPSRVRLRGQWGLSLWWPRSP